MVSHLGIHCLLCPNTYCKFLGKYDSSFLAKTLIIKYHLINILKFCTPKFLKKMAYANSADPDQTAPEGLFVICL